jgi:hypothetical protein
VLMFLHKITIKMSGKTPLPPRPPPRQAIVAASRHRSKGDNRGPLPHASALCSSASEEGEGLMTTTIRPRCPPCHDHLRLQWRPKTIQRSGRCGDDDTIDDQINNQQTTRSGGAEGGLRGDDTMRDKDMRTQQSNRSRGGGGSRRRQRR